MIELLTVIAVIGILAGLLFPAGAAVKRKATLKRVEGELAQIANAIETYKIDKAFYPPDNSTVRNATEASLYSNVNTPASQNSLYYELGGARREGTGYRSLVDNTVVAENILTTAFSVGGVMNANVGGAEPKNYLQAFKPAQYSTGPSGLMVLSTVVKGPTAPEAGPSRFCYAATSQWLRNPSSFDLWVDVIIGGKTNRISNWSDKPEMVSY